MHLNYHINTSNFGLASCDARVLSLSATLNGIAAAIQTLIHQHQAEPFCSLCEKAYWRHINLQLLVWAGGRPTDRGVTAHVYAGK